MKTKKLLSMILVLVFVLSLMPAMALTASATDPYVQLIGRPVAGETLTTEVSGIDGPLSYQWYHYENDIREEITGETGSSYELKQSDVDCHIFVEVNGEEDSSIRHIYDPATLMVIDCGDTGWEYKFWTDDQYKNVTADSSGAYNKVTFYNAISSRDEVSFKLVTGHEIAAPTPYGMSGLTVDSAYLEGLLTAFPGVTGVSVKYNAGTHAVTVTPISEAPPVHTHTDSTTFDKNLPVAGGELAAGNYFLAGDVTLTNNITINSGTVNLCLNGHVLTGNGSGDMNGSVITVDADATLNLYDCGTATHKFDVDPATGLWTLNETDGTQTVTGGCITGGKAPWGGGIQVKTDSTAVFTMDGGNIVGNQAISGGFVGTFGAGHGGGVLVGNGGTFTMNGGSIVGNIAENQGGGAFNFKAKEFTVHGGTISYNQAAYSGGGIGMHMFAGDSSTMDGGTISYNTSPGGGGMFIRGGGFDLTGGSISNNTSTGSGGGIFATDAHVSLKSGEVKNNAANADGGGVELDDQAILLIAGDVEITENQSGSGIGGGISSSAGAITSMTVGGTPKVKDNISSIDGSASNLHLDVDWTVPIDFAVGDDAPAEGMEIHVSNNANFLNMFLCFALDCTDETYQTYFESDDEERIVEYKDGLLWLAPRPTVERIYIDSDGVATINDKTYDVSGEPTDGGPTLDTLGLEYSYDATNGAKLTVSDVDGIEPVIKSDTDDAIESEVDLEIVLNVDTLVKCTESSEGHKAINVNADLKITGKYDLTASSVLSDVISAGNISIDVDTLKVTAKGNEGYGIIANDTLSILGDTVLEVSSKEMGIFAKDIVLNHTGTVMVGAVSGTTDGIGLQLMGDLTVTKTGGMLVYGDDEAMVVASDESVKQLGMLGALAMWTADDPVTPTVEIVWDCGAFVPDQVGGYDTAHTVKLGAVLPATTYYAPSYSVTAPASVENGKVSVNKTYAFSGETVTITVTPDKGYTLETLTAKDANGDAVEVTKVNKTTYTFRMPDSKVTVEASFMEDNSMLNFFVDVPATAYYYDAVLWAAENGITQGTDASHFSPNMGTTRAQVVTFLWRAAGCPEPKGDASKFADVEVGSFYEKAVAWGIENGVVKGTSPTTFSPDMVCTRGQIAAFMARFAGVADADCQTSFIDVSVNAYYASAVAWMLDNGITKGTTDTTYSPDSNCARAQIVTFLYRYLAE